MTSAVATAPARVWSHYQEAIYDNNLNGDGDTLVQGVAGCSKTTVLEHSIKSLSPRERASTVAVAFNDHIVKELNERLPADTTVSTIHGLASSVVYNAVRPTTGREWVKAGKYRWIVGDWMHVHDLTKKDHPDLKNNLVSLIGFCQSTLTDPNDETAVRTLLSHFGLSFPALAMWQIQEALSLFLEQGYFGYKEKDFPLDKRPRYWYKGAKYSIDYNDMIYFPAMLELSVPQYDRLYVDEVQDLNPAQREFLLKTKGSNSRAFWVGDERQAIYGFSGADAASIQQIKQKTRATQLPLSICYRCPTSHIALAQEIVPEIEAADWAIPGEINYTTEDRLYQDGEGWNGGDLILCRTTAPLIDTAFRLMRRKIPVTVRGKDIGRQMDAMIDTVAETKGFSYPEFLTALSDYKTEQSGLMVQQHASDAAIESMYDRCDSLGVLYTSSHHAGVGTVEQLKQYAGKLFSNPKGKVILSTIHKAKGLEADNVFILKPQMLKMRKARQPWAKEQEANLHYVALTRSKRSLTFVNPEKSNVVPYL